MVGLKRRAGLWGEFKVATQPLPTPHFKG